MDNSSILLVIEIICALASGLIAYKRGRSFIGFFVVGLILDLPGLLITYFVTAREYSAEPENKEYFELKPVHLSLVSLFVAGFATISFNLVNSLLNVTTLFFPFFEDMNATLTLPIKIVCLISTIVLKYREWLIFIWLILLFIYFKWVHLVSVKKGLAIAIKYQFIMVIIILVFFYPLISLSVGSLSLQLNSINATLH